MRVRMLMGGLLGLATLPVMALPKAEIERPLGAAQADGAVHTVRQIPEACTRLEGRFTAVAAAPYQLQQVATRPQCRPRAVFVDAAQASPSEASGWKLNEVVRIPSARCSGQTALIEIWRKPVEQPLALDGQGRLRVYLNDARNQAAEGTLSELPQYTARLLMQGNSCG